MAPLLIALLLALVDFGMIFGSNIVLGNGVSVAARAAALNAYAYSGTCSGGPSTATADLVCNVANDIGQLPAAKSGTLQVGICFVTPGSTPSCSGQSGTGTSVTQDVEICAKVQSTWVTGPSPSATLGSALSPPVLSSSSRQLIEQPQPSGSATGYSAFNSKSASVTYSGKTIAGMNCS